MQNAECSGIKKIYCLHRHLLFKRKGNVSFKLYLLHSHNLEQYVLCSISSLFPVSFLSFNTFRNFIVRKLTVERNDVTTWLNLVEWKGKRVHFHLLLHNSIHHLLVDLVGMGYLFMKTYYTFHGKLSRIAAYHSKTVVASFINDVSTKMQIHRIPY